MTEEEFDILQLLIQVNGLLVQNRNDRYYIKFNKLYPIRDILNPSEDFLDFFEYHSFDFYNDRTYWKLKSIEFDILK